MPDCIARRWHIVTWAPFPVVIAGFPFRHTIPRKSCLTWPKPFTMSENREIMLFQNIRQVILAERWCVENRLYVKVIPVPRTYSSECGMCLEMNRKDGDKLEIYTNENGMKTQRISNYK